MSDSPRIDPFDRGNKEGMLVPGQTSPLRIFTRQCRRSESRRVVNLANQISPRLLWILQTPTLESPHRRPPKSLSHPNRIRQEWKNRSVEEEARDGECRLLDCRARRSKAKLARARVVDPSCTWNGWPTLLMNR